MGMLYIALGGMNCFLLVLFLFNLYTVATTFMSKEEEGQSGMAKAAWAVGFLSLLLGPCGWFPALIAMIMARMESNKIWREESPIASATGARMASVNAAFAMLFSAISLVLIVMQIMAATAAVVPPPPPVG